jgi:heme A synthase
MVLVVEVSIFGALVVLEGIPPGLAAVDLGSALMVTALMVTGAIAAFTLYIHPERQIRLTFRSPFAKLALATGVVVYAVLVSGVLVAGNGSLTGCLGWPIYSPGLFLMDLPGAGKSLRLALSIVGIGMILILLAQAWISREQRPATYQAARWTAAAFLIETVVQMLLLVIGREVYLLVPYTSTASVFWALLVAMVILTGLEEQPAS